MNLIALFQFMMKLVLLLLLPLCPLLAQETGKESHKVHIKMIRTVDGKTVVIDTTLTSATHEELIKAMKATRLDTAHMRLLQGKVKAYTIGPSGNAAFGKTLNAVKVDTTLLRSLNGDKRMRVLLADSLLSGEGIRHLIKMDGQAISISGNPQLYIRAEKDSSRTFRLREGQSVRALRPAEFERIVVERGPGKSKTDSLLLKEARAYIRITTDDKTGEHKIYRIEADGTEVEVEGEEIGLGITRPARAIFLVRKAKVEEMTTSEKQQLKDTGAPVEMKAKDELKIEEIRYHPNPSNGRFNLSFTLKNKGTTVVRIMDDKGTEVFVDTIEKLSGEYSRQIDISVFGPGLYFLQVAQGGRYHTKKLLVQ